MNEFPNIVRARLSALKAGDHPDADLLAAFAEQALAKQERSHVLAHLARCSDCREVLAVAMPPLSAAEIATASSIDTARGHFWFRGHGLRWATAAACVVIVGSAVVMKRDVLMKSPARTVALRQETSSTYASDEADKQTDLSGAAASQQLAAPPLSEREGKAAGNLSASARMQVPSSTRVPDQKKVLPSNPEPPSAAPAVAASAGTMRPEFTHSPMAGGAMLGAVGGGRAQAPFRNQPSPIASLNENKIDKEASKPAAAPSEQIEVTAAMPLIEGGAAGSREKQELPGKAKAPAGVAMYDALVSAPSQESSDQTVLAKETARRAEMKRMETLRTPVARWTISSDGQLQHSVDSGKTWQAVAVAENATFRALSANGPDLWVGGASGLLYHSTDAGAHWTRVKPVTTDATLTADIAAIEFIDVHQGKITTSTGEVWITTDSGQTWRKQS